MTRLVALASLAAPNESGGSAIRAAAEAIQVMPPALSRALPTTGVVHGVGSEGSRRVSRDALVPTEARARGALGIGSGESASVGATTTMAGLDEEIAWVGRAQRLLATDPSTALELADAYPSRFPRGSLRQESEVVAVDALVRLHRSDDAVARAERFLGAYDTSTVAPRMRALRNTATQRMRSP